MTITLNGTTGISTPDLESSGPVTGTTATFSGNVTLGSSVLVTPTGSAPSYTCRAWVNFNGTGTVAIRASGNVSSITDNGVGDYTVNFATAMPDSNYSVAVAGRVAAGTIGVLVANANSTGANVAGSCRLGIGNDNTTGADGDFVYVAIFR
jgi:hypothetical protein